jgi:hypothetical protein
MGRIEADLARGTISREDLGAALSARIDARLLGYPGIETVATPLLFAAFRPFTLGDYEGSYRVFAAVSLALLFGSIWALARLAGGSRTTALLAAGALPLVLAPVQSDLGVGNVNALQLGLATAFVGLHARSDRAAWAASGAVLAFAILLKPNVAPVAIGMAAWWLRNRMARRAAWTALGAAGGVVLSLALTALVFGTLSCWTDWLRISSQVLASPRGVADGNFALSRLLIDGAGVDLSSALPLALIAAWLLASLWPRPQDRAGSATAPDAARPLLPAAMGLVVGLLSLRLAWVHYFLLVVPLALRLAAPASPSRPIRPILVAVALAMLVGPVDELIGRLGRLAPAVAFDLSAGLLFALGLVATRREPSEIIPRAPTAAR